MYMILDQIQTDEDHHEPLYCINFIIKGVMS